MRMHFRAILNLKAAVFGVSVVVSVIVIARSGVFCTFWEVFCTSVARRFSVISGALSGRTGALSGIP